MSIPWICESIRLSALWRAVEPYGSALSWEQVAGAPPETKEEQPRRGTSRQVGPVTEGRHSLEMQTAPGRVDWILTGLPGLVVDSGISPSVGSPPDALDEFERFLFEKAANAYAAPRFALGIVANCPESGQNESYARLTELLRSIRPTFAGAFDFLYQINRPRRALSVPDLGVNRLSRWASVTITNTQFLLSNLSSQVSKPPVIATRVELDLSSSAEREQPIPEQLRIGLFHEFKRLALELLEKGDMP